ncbi:hypothetical protein V5O48_019448, partial [Marasmius crinis-equi]
MPNSEVRTSDSVLGPPLSTINRRERLLRIGSTNSVPVVVQNDLPSPTEVNPLRSNSANGLSNSYGSIQTTRSAIFRKGSRTSNPPSPTISTRDLRHSLSLTLQRPISAYDAPLHPKNDGDAEIDAKINGIR